MDKEIYKVIVFHSAYKDLANIKHYWEKMLEKNADEFIAEIYFKIKKLEDFPFAHRQASDKTLQKKGYRILSVRNYYIFYVVLNDEVQVRRILYSKMNFSRLL